MTQSDFREGLDTLTAAYSGGVNTITQLDSSAALYVQDILRLGMEVTSSELEFAHDLVGDFLREPESIAKNREAIRELVEILDRGEPTKVELWGQVLLGTLEQYLNRVAGELGRGISRSEETQKSSLRIQMRTVDSLLAKAEQIALMRRLRFATQAAEESAKQAKQAEEAARNSAGYAAGSKLTERFQSLARRHFWASNLFRLLTAAGVLAGVYGALQVPPHEVAEPGAAIFRVSVLAGVMGLATYFGRQAAHHRDIGAWASTIKEQLLTFDGYVDPVSDPQLRDQMRAAFAARVFGSSPESKDEPAATLSSPLLGEVAALFAKAK